MKRLLQLLGFYKKQPRKYQYRKYIATKNTVALTKGKTYKGRVDRTSGKVLLYYSGGYYGNFGTENLKITQ